MKKMLLNVALIATLCSLAACGSGTQSDPTTAGTTAVGQPISGPDSGYAVCKRFEKKVKAEEAVLPDNLTEQEYQQIRSDFDNSRYADIKQAGVLYLDSFKRSQAGEKTGQLLGSFVQLEMACNSHGTNMDLFGNLAS